MTRSIYDYEYSSLFHRDIVEQAIEIPVVSLSRGGDFHERSEKLKIRFAVRLNQVVL